MGLLPLPFRYSAAALDHQLFAVVALRPCQCKEKVHAYLPEIGLGPGLGCVCVRVMPWTRR